MCYYYKKPCKGQKSDQGLWVRERTECTGREEIFYILTLGGGNITMYLSKLIELYIQSG